MNQEKTNHTPSFVGVLTCFIIALFVVWIMVEKNTGILVAFLTSIIFCVMVFKLPSVLSVEKAKLVQFKILCCFATCIIFLCLSAIVFPEKVRELFPYFNENTHMMNIIIFVTYLSTALIVSKRYEIEEKKIENEIESESVNL